MGTALPRIRRWCLAACLVAMASCGPSSNTLSRQNDELRRQNLDLQRQVEQLQEKIRLREGQVAAMEQQIQSPTPVPGADVPQLAAIDFARYTGAIDTDGDGRTDTVRAYIKTVDQEGRFLPVAGRAVAQVIASAPHEEPRRLAEKTFEPAAFAKSYRSGITGTHYTLDVPLPADTGESGALGNVTLEITFTDARSGATFTRQTPIVLK